MIIYFLYKIKKKSKNEKYVERYNGLTYLSEVFKGHPLCHQICFDRDNETVRSEFARIAAQML